MRSLIILALLVSLAGCRADEESTVRGDIDDARTTATDTAPETPPARESRGSIETQSEAPLGTDATIGTTSGTDTATRTQP